MMKSVLFSFASLGLFGVSYGANSCTAGTRTVTVTVYEDEPSTSPSSLPDTEVSVVIPTFVSSSFLPSTAPTTVPTSGIVFVTKSSSSASSAAVSVNLPTTFSTSASTAPVSSPKPSTSATSAKSEAAGSTTTSASSSSGSSVSGKSTFYGGNLSGGMCSFTTYTLPSNLYGTAFSGQVWDSAANCGRCVKVTGPNGNTITAMIVDQCPECDAGHLDLFQNAFEKIGSISDGIISTSYTFVDCGISSPIVLHNKSGTSQHWFSMQVVNANTGVASLEVSTDGGSTWQSTTRRDYNFFENSSGFGTDTVDVRVTSSTGSTVVVSNVSVASDSETTASSNFS